MIARISLIIFFAVFSLAYFTGFKNAQLVEAIVAGIAAIALCIEGGVIWRV